MRTLEAARRRYARKLRRKARIRSKRLIRAFAEVPREHYLGPGPWKIITRKGYRLTRSAHPRHVYDDVLIGICPERLLNNGQPSGLAAWFDALEPRPNEHVVHIGCGTGYYTAILAHVVGPRGRVIAVEIDVELAARARENLAHLRNVEVVQGDGARYDAGPADAIFVNAGATHPCALWLDSLKPGGRLMFPLITTHECWLRAFRSADGRHKTTQWKGRMIGLMLLVTRVDSAYSACVISSVGIFPCIGAIERDEDRRVAEALSRGAYESIRSIRRDAHQPDATCWLHRDRLCLSTVEAQSRTRQAV